MKKMFLHIDGDAFFASCEVALRPGLRGKPVVVGGEKGIASAMSYEAKARGVVRGMPMFEVRKICPDVVVFPTDHRTYSIFAERMYSIVRRYVSDVEEYSIDECFGDITSIVDTIYEKGGGRVELTAFAKRIQDDLYTELGITFSVGIGPTRVLAKIGSKFMKPRGCTVILEADIPLYLVQTPIRKVWGIGGSTSVSLSKLGIRTGLDFTQKEEWWVRQHCSRPAVDIWYELRGVSVHGIEQSYDHVQKSISRTRTFTPATRDVDYILSELSQNAEEACSRARATGLTASRFSYFIKTSDFVYMSHDVKLAKSVNTPEVIMKHITDTFGEVFKPHVMYRSSGVTLHGLHAEDQAQGVLFSNMDDAAAPIRDMYGALDALTHSIGHEAVFLASSLRAHARSSAREARAFGQDTATIRRFGIPYMGLVR